METFPRRDQAGPDARQSRRGRPSFFQSSSWPFSSREARGHASPSKNPRPRPRLLRRPSFRPRLNRHFPKGRRPLPPCSISRWPSLTNSSRSSHPPIQTPSRPCSSRKTPWPASRENDPKNRPGRKRRSGPANLPRSAPLFVPVLTCRRPEIQPARAV